MGRRHKHATLRVARRPSILARIAAGFFLCFTLQLEAQTLQSDDDLREVDIQVFLIDVNSVDDVSESFVANVYLQLRWHDPELAHDGADSISKKLDEIWYPRVQILNRQQVTNTFPETAEIRPDGEIIYRQRLYGTFSNPLELVDFPFDTQRLQLTFVDVGFGDREIHFGVSPDSELYSDLEIPDWEIVGWDFSAAALPLGADSSLLAGAVFSLDVKRHASFYILKVIFPLMLIVAMSWLIFWIDPSMAAVQISVSVTAMLTLIAYRFAIGGMVPRLSFLTSLDYFVLASSILVFLSLLEAIYTANLSQTNQLKRARATDGRARWMFPLIYTGLVMETLYFRAGF